MLAYPRILAFTLALVGLVPLGASAAESLPAGVSAGPSIEAISEYTLDNGLRVLLFPDNSKPTVTVNVTYGVGSAQENYGETGMAHLLEHLVFKGTPTHTDITGEMKRRGIGYNGTTSMDRTNYFASFPANDETLDWLLGMEADRMVNSNIAQSDLDSEMTVVRNELESGENNPGTVLFQRMGATAYLWHNYGNSTIGARSDVESVPIDRLQAFYRTWYQPDNATLIIAGRIDPGQTLARIATHFGELERPARSLPRLYTAEPPQDGEREVTVRRVGDLQLVAAVYHVPAITHPDTAALGVLANLMGHTPGGRLHKSLVEPGIAAAAGSGSDALRDPGLFRVFAVVPPSGDMAKAEQALLEQVEAIASRPVSAGEVAAAKQRIANAYDLYFTDVNAVGVGLSEFIAAGDWRLLFVARDAAAAVEAEDVNRVAAQYLRSSNRTVGRFVPANTVDRVQVPVAPLVASLVEGYTGRAAVDAGEDFDPSPQNIQARTETFTLGDGLKVSLLPKRTRGGTVVVSASFRFGDEASVARSPDPAGSLAGAMLMRGSENLTREQITQRFEALQTTASIGGGIQAAQVSMLSRRQHLAEALDLAAEILRTPAFPQSEFEQLRLQAITGLEASRREPGSVAGQAMAQHFDPWPEGHPLHAKTLDESLANVKALRLEDLRNFHRNFYGTSAGEIAVVGDFDPVAVRRQLQALFADWKAPVAYAPINTRYTEVPARSERFETPDKPNAILLARSNIALKVTDPDYMAMTVANHVFGGGALKSRLGDRIRQKEGLSYGVSSGVRADDSVGQTDDAGSFSIQALAAPANVDRVEAAVREELALIVAAGVTAQELADAKSGLLTQRQQGRASDGNVASMLADQLHYGRTMAFSAELDQRLQALTLEQVNAAIRKHLDPAALSMFVAGDFNSVGTGEQ